MEITLRYTQRHFLGIAYIQIVDADRTPTRCGIVKLGTGVLCVDVKAVFDNC